MYNENDESIINMNVISDVDTPKIIEKEDSIKVDESKSDKAYHKLGYWTQFFDVNESDMKQRLLALKNPNSIELSNIINDRLDFYGPLWISITLIFCIFNFGNLNNIYTNKLYNYQLIPSACSLIWGFTIVISIINYFIVKFNDGSISIMKLICLYGYSLIYFIPFTIFSIIPIFSLQYIFMIIPGIISGLFLKNNSKNILKNPNNRNIILMSLSNFIFQIFLGILIKFNFYNSN